MPDKLMNIEGFSVGDATIDAQHKEMFHLIDTILADAESNKPEEKIRAALSILGSYITCHLAHEEVYMIKHAFPLLDEHIKQHEEFQSRFLKFRNSYDRDEIGNDLYQEIRVYVRNWWFKHVLVEDHKYYVYIRDNVDSHPADEASDYHNVDQKDC